MYFNIGTEVLIKEKNILGIFDLDNTTVSKATREYINTAEKNGECITVSFEELPNFIAYFFDADYAFDSDVLKKVQKHTELVCLHVKGEPLLHSDLEMILEILENYNLKYLVLYF